MYCSISGVDQPFSGMTAANSCKLKFTPHKAMPPPDSISDEAYSTPEDYNFNITFNVEALPDDVQYRTCDLKFWQKGAYMLIKVAQSADSGAPEYDGIETLTVSPAATSDLRHNIAGQKVSKEFKGIIISNNKKFVNK